jgi:hypothetical protein
MFGYVEQKLLDRLQKNFKFRHMFGRNNKFCGVKYHFPVHLLSYTFLTSLALLPFISWAISMKLQVIFLWLIGGDWRKVPFDDQRRRSSNIAAMAAILDLLSVDYLTNGPIFLWLIGGDWRKIPFDDQNRHSSNMAAILDLASVEYLTIACVDRSDFFVAHWGYWRKVLLSIISSVAHPRWPIRPSSWIWIPLIF